MRTPTVPGLIALLLVAAVATARAEGPVPRTYRQFTPAQVVEQVMAQQVFLGLTDDQLTQLEALRLVLRTEPHRYLHRGGKPHTTEHVPMTTRQQAWDRAFAILTPAQALRLEAVVAPPTPAKEARRAPRRPIIPHGKP